MNATISTLSPSARAASAQVRRGTTSSLRSTATRAGSIPMVASSVETVVPGAVVFNSPLTVTRSSFIRGNEA